MNPTKLIRPWFVRRARRTDAWARDGEEIQTRQLRRLLTAAMDTEPGRRYAFADLGTMSDPRGEFRRRVPMIAYEEIRDDVMRMIAGERDVLWPGVCRDFAQSSGTSGGKSKYIPITPRALSACHYAGAADNVAHYLRHHPESRLFTGRGFILGGSFANELQLADKRVRVGDLSATLISRINPLAELVRVPSRKIALLADWHEKLPRLVEAASRADITSISGVPSWFLAVIKEVMRRRGATTLTDVWPHLEVFFHGGISFEPYREIYRELISGDGMHYVESYNASEGFFAVQDRPGRPGMLLTLDNDIYYEFLPLGAAEPVGLADLRVGGVYELVITASNGLWRYRLGDTVRVVTVAPVRIAVAGRTKSFINAFGEELMEENAERAMAAACRRLGCAVADYTAAPVYADGERRGRHQWLVEWERPPRDVGEFGRVLDEELRRLNSDYDAKRSGEWFLDSPEVVTLPAGSFAAWLASVGTHKLGGQRKVPRLSNHRAVADALLSLCK